QWNTRTQVSIKSAIVMDSVSWNNKVDGQTGKKSFGPYDLEISFLQKAERAGTAINIQRFKPANGGAKPVFVAIPVENLANFDPFIYISISFPGDTTKYAAPVVGMYDGREIYYNIHAKKQRKIPVTSPQETQLRKGFDGSYNSPVPPGKSCIILKVYLTANAPENMSITASGALKHLRWL
ncbi:MAG TPA: hypothetical protein PKE30_17875, partial [Niabella sp.]|nr:hypothetical protein [Niabella sp.]